MKSIVDTLTEVYKDTVHDFWVVGNNPYVFWHLDQEGVKIQLTIDSIEVIEEVMEPSSTLMIKFKESDYYCVYALDDF